MAEQKEPTMADVLQELAAMRSTIAEQNKTIVDLKGKVAETAINEGMEEVPTIPTEKVKRDKKEYAWQLATFVLPGYGKLKAEEAALDDDIIDAILKVPGQGILKELV